MTLAVTLPSPFIGGVFPGNEAKGAKTIAQLESLLLVGETIDFATGGDGGGALFTNKRLIIVNDAGLFSKRSVVSFIKAAVITAVSIDASSFLEVKLAGHGFGGAHLFFDADQDPSRISRWCATAMAD
ncbi:PH domain-containing protein [Erythrobacter sp. T5W1-R]|uniref:PH domain-containing protein n=1 Tax=Erythrobacter sp. T5W1-R TaxID=3101752 RepID=UPI002AFDEA2F|nr:PH domain-containing protein [Erythrobacter sp. T5W1-R]MEA1619994.1 PH domain-containing protein [Erythrobacter sp. T5W1-R]